MMDLLAQIPPREAILALALCAMSTFLAWLIRALLREFRTASEAKADLASAIRESAIKSELRTEHTNKTMQTVAEHLRDLGHHVAEIKGRGTK